MQNLINIEPDDNVRAFINVRNLNDEDYINNNFIVLCTTKGIIVNHGNEGDPQGEHAGKDDADGGVLLDLG